jgi:hypothetical protein
VCGFGCPVGATGVAWEPAKLSARVAYLAAAGDAVAATKSGSVGRVGKRVLMSVGGPCPHEAVQAKGHDDDDRQHEEFHDRFPFLAPGR